METILPVVEITVKPEPVENENAENEQNGYNQQTDQVKEEELWIKPEPLEDDSQDSITKDEDQETISENEARLDEEALKDECNRNRQSNAPSRKQIRVFLDFLNEHRELANCMLRRPASRAKAQHLWESIAERLNSISGCIKTTQQWQRVWSDKKYLTRKAAATRYASLSTGGLLAPELTLQDERILAIIGEPIPPRRFGPKSGTPEPKPHIPKQPQEVLVVSVPPKQGSVTIDLEPPVTPTEWVNPHPEVPSIPPRKPYTPRKTESLRKEGLKKSDKPESEVPPTPVIPPDLLSQPDVSKPPDDLSKPVAQKQDEPPLTPSISEPSSPLPTQQDFNRRGRIRLRASLDPYTKKFIHLEEERLKNDARRNTELSEIRLSLQQGTAELAGIRTVMQEMLGIMKQMTKSEEKK